jgi:capsular polysaccharide biosynthesis protein
MNGKPRGEPGAARQPAIRLLDRGRSHLTTLALASHCGFKSWRRASLLLVGSSLGPKFTASAKLHRYETPGESDFFKTPLSSETFAALILSPEVLRPLGDSMIPPLPAERLAKFIKVDPQPDADIINVYYASKDPRQAVAFLNDFATNAVSYVRRWYSERAEAVAKDYLAREVSQMDADISALEDKFRNLHVPPELTNKLAQVGSALSALGTNLNSVPVSSAVLAKQRERLDAALGELGELTSKYTDLHPLVQAKRQQINSMESQLASMATNRTVVMAPSPTTSGHTAAEVFNPETDIVRTKLLALQDGRVQLSTRFREAELYAANPPGIVRVLAPASMQTLQSAHRRVKIGLLTIFGGCLGVVAGLGLVLLVEFIDTRLKTAEDLKRVTTLPVLTTLGNLDTMSSEDRSLWAFRAWTMLQGKLSHSPNHGLVCGITSSSAGEGRSTWVHLLAEAASLTGFRVLTIATRPSPTGSQLEEGDVEPDPQQLAMAMDEFDNSHSSALTTSVLSSPAQVTEQLTGPDPRPVVHIPLPGWVWDLERRRQWREALEHWATIDKPGDPRPSCRRRRFPKRCCLARTFPTFLWLASNRQARAHHTRETTSNAQGRTV